MVHIESMMPFHTLIISSDKLELNKVVKVLLLVLQSSIMKSFHDLSVIERSASPDVSNG